MNLRGNLYEDSRSDSDELFRVVYADECRVLMRSNKRHERSGRRVYQGDYRDTFEEYVKSGRYKPAEETADAPSMPAEVAAEEQEWAEIDGVGEKTERKLREAGISTDHDVATAEDSTIIGVYGMSEAKLKRMKQHIQ